MKYKSLLYRLLKRQFSSGPHPGYYLDVIILCYFSASSVRSFTICASLRSVHNNYDLLQHFRDETHYSLVTFHTNRDSRKNVLQLKQIFNISTSSFLYFFLTSFVKGMHLQFNKISPEICGRNHHLQFCFAINVLICL